MTVSAADSRYIGDVNYGDGNTGAPVKKAQKKDWNIHEMAQRMTHVNITSNVWDAANAFRT